MKKFQFLLLDSGPIIKLFEMSIWNDFIKLCDVTVTRTVAEEAKYAHLEREDVRIDLKPYEEDGRINVIDVELSVVRDFHDRFDPLYKAEIDPGEKEILAFLCLQSQVFQLCFADGAVFRVLGLLQKGHQGISLEEVLAQIGLSHTLEWKYTERFREKYNHLGQIQSVQGEGLL